MLARSKRKNLMWFSLLLLLVNGGMAMYQYFTFTSNQEDNSVASQQMDEHSLAMLNDELTKSDASQHDQAPTSEESIAVRAARLEDEFDFSEEQLKTDQHAIAKRSATEHKPAGHDQTQKAITAESSHGTKQHEVAAKHEAESYICYAAGVFSTRATARKLEKQLVKRDIEATINRKIKREKLGYWVYLKPERSLALSRLKAEEIKLKGLTDVAVVTHSTPKWAISLGVFRYKKTAKERKIKAEALGLKPLMTSRYKTETQYRVHMKMAMSKEPSENDWKELLKGQKNIEIKPMECP